MDGISAPALQDVLVWPREVTVAVPSDDPQKSITVLQDLTFTVPESASFMGPARRQHGSMCCPAALRLARRSRYPTRLLLLTIQILQETAVGTGLR
jgi:hypothetical protein